MKTVKRRTIPEIPPANPFPPLSPSAHNSLCQTHLPIVCLTLSCNRTALPENDFLHFSPVHFFTSRRCVTDSCPMQNGARTCFKMIQTLSP
ncbi:hypothetical protein CEXT_24811 [Caerostris extrusa]|uniref:Uncharacterized protein n=1 Tax=Caerostris extrusa TaxID=172846 RepID=A0AAV4XV11_CAEEX|nr:hypothetical protein CEXT_24811 [Caerostris extrusa]